MADDATNKPNATDSPAIGINAETTLSKDGDLGINKPVEVVEDKTAEPTVKPAEPLDMPTPPAPDSFESKPAEDLSVSKPMDATEEKPTTAPSADSLRVDSSDPTQRVDSPDPTLRVDFTPPPSSQPEPSANSSVAEPLITATEAGEKSAEASSKPLDVPISKPLDEKPVVVSAKEAEAADGLGGSVSSPEDQLSDQVETLTGEIQALESKIEHLAGSGSTETGSEKPNATGSLPMMPPMPPGAPTMPPPPTNPDTMLPPMPDLPTPATAEKSDQTESMLPAEVAKKEEAKPLEAKPTNKPEDKSAVATFSDIFSKSDKEKPDKNGQDAAAPPSLMPEAPKATSDVSAAATIGEVLGFFGILVLAVLLLGPFYKSLVSDSLYSTIKVIAWLVAPTSLLISFIVLLFAKGKTLFKIAIFILLLVTVVFYLGINTNGTISDALNSMLGTLFSAYK